MLKAVWGDSADEESAGRVRMSEAPGVWGLGFGVWCLVFGVWCLVFDVECLMFSV